MTAEQFGKRVLIANGVFCGACGLALVLMPGVLTDLMFNAPERWLLTAALVLGAGLVATSVVAFWVSRDTARLAQHLYHFTAMDAAWVLGSGVVLMVFGAVFTATGWYIVAGIALVVADFAVAEFVAARKLSTPGHPYQRANA